MKDVVLIKNEMHKLTEGQRKLMEERFGYWDEINIPRDGLTFDEQMKLLDHHFGINGTYKGKKVVFLSPIPGVLARVFYSRGLWTWYTPTIEGPPDNLYIEAAFILLNDQRKKEEKDGKIIMTIPEDGWYLYGL